MGNCRKKKCCCGGCGWKPFDSRISTGLLHPEQQYCCSCIPLGLCVSVTIDGVTRTRNLWPHCTVTPDGDDYILFSGTFTWGDSFKTLYFRLKVAAGGCYFCVDGDGVEQQCVLIDHSDRFYPVECADEYGNTLVNECDEASQFCCDWIAEFELTDGYTTATIVTGKTELIDVDAATDCDGCDCICACACFTVIVDNEEFAATNGTETVCAVSDEYGGVAWTHSSGFSISLRGKDPTGFDSWTLIDGTETAGTAEGVEIRDNDPHVIESYGGGIDVVYVMDTATANKSTNATWYGYVSGPGSTAVLSIYNWSTGYYEEVCTVVGRDAPVTLPLHFDLSDAHTGTGVNEGLIAIRIESDDAASVATDHIRFTTPDCCAMELTTPISVTGDTSAVSLQTPNTCPNPTASWELFTPEGDAIFVVWACVFCDQCDGIIGEDCCPNPIPRVLTATVEIDCYTTPCDPAEFPIIETGVDLSVWEGNGSWCTGTITLSMSMGGYDCFNLIAETASGCEFTVTAVEYTCSPFRVVFTGYLSTGLDCCPDELGTGQSFTVTITE